MSTIISISGNIGCGKSTVMTNLRSRWTREGSDHISDRTTKFIEEPVDEWKPYLDAFYSDPSKYALPLQLQILKSYNDMWEDSGGDITLDAADATVIERSPFESLNVFAKVLHADNQLTDDEYSVLLNEKNVWKPDYVIYLRSSPETCFERVSRRNRSTEKSGISLDYLRKIHKEYDGLYNNSPVSSVTVVNAEADVDKVLLDIQDALSQITCVDLNSWPLYGHKPNPLWEKRFAHYF